MGVRPYNEARKQALKKYDEKTYSAIMFRFRLVDDADILQSIQDARDAGIPLRVWVRNLYDNQKDQG